MKRYPQKIRINSGMSGLNKIILAIAFIAVVAFIVWVLGYIILGSILIFLVLGSFGVISGFFKKIYYKFKHRNW